MVPLDVQGWLVLFWDIPTSNKLVWEGQEVCTFYNVFQKLKKNCGLHTNLINKKRKGCRFHTVYVYMNLSNFEFW